MAGGQAALWLTYISKTHTTHGQLGTRRTRACRTNSLPLGSANYATLQCSTIPSQALTRTHTDSCFFLIALLARDGGTDAGPVGLLSNGVACCGMVWPAAHSGLVVGLGSLVEEVMITVCWTGSNLVGFMKALKYIELCAFNMFALTNLAICVNLALVISVSKRRQFEVIALGFARFVFGEGFVVSKKVSLFSLVFLGGE